MSFNPFKIPAEKKPGEAVRAMRARFVPTPGYYQRDTPAKELERVNRNNSSPVFQELLSQWEKPTKAT